MVNSNQQQAGYPMLGDLQRNAFQNPYLNGLITNSPYENYMGGRYMQQQNNVTSSNQFLKCRPVSSKEEARAFQIDLDGSLWVFTDVGNQKIYTKQINADGTAAFKTYAFIEDEAPYSSNDYITREEFNKVIQVLTAAIQQPNSQQVAESAQNNSENKQQPLMNF